MSLRNYLAHHKNLVEHPLAFAGKTLQSLTSHWFVRSVMTTTASIILAFMVDRWNEQRKETEAMDRSITNLCQEQVENLALLDSVIPPQVAYRDSLAAYETDSSMTLMTITSKPPFLQMQLPNMVAYNFLREQDGTKKNYELIAQLSKLELLQEEVSENYKQISTKLYEPETNSADRAGNLQKMLLYNMMGNYIVQEINLGNGYIDFLKAMQGKGYIPSQKIPNKRILNSLKKPSESWSH